MTFAFLFFLGICLLLTQAFIIKNLKTYLLGSILSITMINAHADHHGKKKDIVDTAVAAGSFKTLVAAVKAAGLVDTLKGKGPFTVFAPTDEAFAKLPKGTVESLLKPENKSKLADILTYHVVAAKVPAAKVKSGKVGMVNKKNARVRVKDGKVTINKANVVKTDIMTSNGIIHVIDAVIMPPKGGKGGKKKSKN